MGPLPLISRDQDDTMNHYLIFEAPQDGHTVVAMVQATSRYAAMKRYVEEEYSPRYVRFNDGGSVTDVNSLRPVTYPHLLAFIETKGKARGDWQMRRLPESTWEAPYRQVFCGEHGPDVENYIELCRPVFRKEFPRSRAHAFLWYLTDGYLVTFYRRPRRSGLPLQILKRYIILHETYPQVLPWEGTYEEFLNRLDL